MPVGAGVNAASDAPDPIGLCLGRRISPPVMLARMALSGASAAAIRSALSSRPGTSDLLALVKTHSAAIDRLGAMCKAFDHSCAADIAGIAAMFDAAVAMAPEASVAAYCLNDQALLLQATAELLGWLFDQSLFADGMDVLDLGCGFGRVAAALAPRARSVLGLDVSSRMIAEARRRYGDVPGLHFDLTVGDGLASVPAENFDLVLAADCFPYLFQARVAEAHIAAAARVLRPRGTLVILNLSYAGDTSCDRKRALCWATTAGLTLERESRQPFTLWDGEALVFRLTSSRNRGVSATLRPGAANGGSDWAT